jgi:signal peptidase I
MEQKDADNQGAEGSASENPDSPEPEEFNLAAKKQYIWGGLFLLFGLYIFGSYISAGPSIDNEDASSLGPPIALLLVGVGIYFMFFGRKFFTTESDTLEYFEAIAMAVGIALTVRAFFVEPFKIPSGSMIPTLLVGDYLFVSKSAYGFRLPFTQERILMGDGPSRGDVAVFEYPRDPEKDYIKRIIGLPGDRIVYRSKRLYINGKPIEYKAMGPYNYKTVQGDVRESAFFTENLGNVSHPILVQSYSFMDGYTDQVIPEGHYFVMGDNRDNSNDSRAWGFVPAHRLVGKALRIFWSWDQHSEAIADGVRWDRLWTPVD